MVVLTGTLLAHHCPAKEVAQSESLIVVHRSHHHTGPGSLLADGRLEHGQIRPAGDREDELHAHRAVHLANGAEEAQLAQGAY